MTQIPLPDSAFLRNRDKRLLIDGTWVAPSGGGSFGAFNPATGERLADIAKATTDDVDRAVAAARRAFEGPWSRFTPADRQVLLLKIADLVESHAEELGTLETLDMGAPLARTSVSVRRVASRLRFYAGMAVTLHGETIANSQGADYFSYTLKEPVGVVGAIIPWNAPLSSAIWKLGPVLATGCTVVLKPSEEASLTPLRLGELMQEAGVPDGVVNILTGHGAVGAAIAAHMDVDKVAFTGSEATGRSIIQASAGNIKRLSLELGGKSANIVFADADMEEAVAGAAMACFSNSGQICSAGTRLFIEDAVHDEFVDRLCAFTRRLRVGNGLAPDTQLGPLVSQRQLDQVCRHLASGREAGVNVMCGGERLGGEAYDKGYFLSPTVLTGVEDSMEIARREIFGPVLSVMRFGSLDEVAARANGTTYGLGGGIWSRDVRKVHALARKLRTGTVWVNCYQVMDAAVPFGGYKMSGYGRESGIQQMDEYLNVKAVWIK